MILTFIVDNYVDKANLCAEHGFSCLIELNKYKYLFDAAQSDVLIKNCNTLCVDFSDISAIFLSHGHYDHTGGLYYLSDIINKKLDVYCHSNIFDNHLRKRVDDGYTYIGIDEKSKNSSMFNFIYNNEFSQINNSIYLSGTIKRYEQFDMDSNLFVDIDGVIKKDMFRDEQFMVIKSPSGIVVLSGCSHCGIINIVEYAKELFPNEYIKAVVGGFHLFRSSKEQVRNVAEYLFDSDIGLVVSGHCTGMESLFELSKILGNRFIPIKAGLSIEL